MLGSAVPTARSANAASVTMATVPTESARCSRKVGRVTVAEEAGERMAPSSDLNRT